MASAKVNEQSGADAAEAGGTRKRSCRLCYYETTDTVDLFGAVGTEKEFLKKIRKYLYLMIEDKDESQCICWMCSQQLETIHHFYTKINEIQRNTHKENYSKMVVSNDCWNASSKIVNANDIVNADIIILADNNPTRIECANNEPGDAAVNRDNSKRALSTTKQCDKLIQPDDCDLYAITIIPDLDESVNDLDKTPSATEERPQEPVRRSGRTKKPIMCLEVLNTECVSPPPPITFKEPPADEDGQTKSETKTQSETIKCESNKLDKSTSSSANGVVSDEPLAKRPRGRPKRKISSESPKEKAKITSSNLPKPKPVNSADSVMYDEENDDEGASEDEFPARDSGDEDWPAGVLDEFPKRILKDGLLLFKGPQLMRMVCKFYSLKCEICTDSNHRYKNLNELFAHYSNDHQTTGYVQCCQTKLSRYPAIIMHMARHLQPDAFQCETCGYVVARPRFLESHRKTHLPDSEKPFGCDICARRFCWKNALQVHMITHQAPEDRKHYVCDVCGKIYDTAGSLCTHKRWHHSGKTREPCFCHICAKHFATRAGLNEHMASIHQPREKNQLQCAECGKWVMNQRCLKSHMILHTTVELHCDLCNYTTKKPVLLKRHQVTKHSDQKPFACSQCDKTFKMKRALTVHVSTSHGAPVSYQCPFCNRRFNSSTNFYTHRKNYHPVELAEMNKRAAEAQRLKRIRAGIERVDEKSSKPTVINGGSGDGDSSTTGLELSEYNDQSDDLVQIEMIPMDEEDEDDDDEEPSEEKQRKAEEGEDDEEDEFHMVEVIEQEEDEAKLQN